jgi:N6-adenosine-specific RNA methylase IME4
MKKYQIIYADPPWDVKRGPDWNSNGPSKPLPYPTMTIEAIKALPIKDLSDTNCHLYLWTINKYIKESYEVVKEWGFDVSCMLTWVKPKHGIGIGGTFVQTTEHLLFCRRGTLKAKKRIDTTWFEHKRLKHSEKPPMFRKMIEEVSGDLPRIELFARQKTEGWDVWGNEVESDIKL